MNKQAVLHIPCSNYSFAKSENEVVLRIRTARDDNIKKISVVYGCKYEFTEKQSVKEVEKRYSDKLFDFYETEILLDNVRFVYIFYIESDDGNFYFSEDGFTAEYNYSLGFYNFFQIPYINKADVHEVVPWMREAVFYQIFVDRFRRGDFKKDNRYINLSWGEAPKQDSFAGGDLKGIIEKLDYIKGLNANAIYLTPVFKSKSNHKYDISDYFAIDEHFGSESDFRTLVNSAHEKGMRIVLDAVFNHASEDLKQFQDVIKHGKSSEYYDWFIIDGDKIDRENVNYEVFAHCSYMPKFNTSNPAVRDFLLSVACFWTKEYNIDGWRLDVSDEISHDFWRSFRKAVREINPECVIIGENWHDAYPFLMGDQYDGIMNYSFTKACLDYFAFNAFDSADFNRHAERKHHRQIRKSAGENRLFKVGIALVREHEEILKPWLFCLNHWFVPPFRFAHGKFSSLPSPDKPSTYAHICRFGQEALRGFPPRQACPRP